MTIYRGVSGVNREIKEQYRGLGGVNRQIKEQYRGSEGVNRTVFASKYELPPLIQKTISTSANGYMIINDGFIPVLAYRTWTVPASSKDRACQVWFLFKAGSGYLTENTSMYAVSCSIDSNGYKAEGNTSYTVWGYYP